MGDWDSVLQTLNPAKYNFSLSYKGPLLIIALAIFKEKKTNASYPELSQLWLKCMVGVTWQW